MSRRRLYRRGAVTTLAVVAALGIAACGDDGNDDSGSADATAAETTTTAAGGGGGETIKIGETEYKLDPSDATVKAGEVTFDVTNDGAIVHNLEVEGPGEEMTTEDLQPGQTGQITVDLSKPGTYEMYCSIDSHREQGMEGEITVQ